MHKANYKKELTQSNFYDNLCATSSLQQLEEPEECQDPITSSIWHRSLEQRNGRQKPAMERNAIYSLNLCLRSDTTSWNFNIILTLLLGIIAIITTGSTERGALFQKKEKDCATSLYQLQPRAGYVVVNVVLLLPYLKEKYRFSRC